MLSEKVLKTCSDQDMSWFSLEFKVHLNALKNFTYGNHIFALKRCFLVVTDGDKNIFIF